MTCPPADVLLGFAAGELGAADSDELETHIDGCSECRAALSSLVRGAVPEARFGRYRIDTVLGGGGMGIVYRAYDPQLARPVAIKVVRRADDDESQRARLVREAQSLARLSHPNVCQVHDVGREGDEVWVAMELIDGVDLRQWSLGRRGAEVEAALLDAARGLAAAHAAGLVHRDVKPENVLMTRDSRAVVTDFGLARHDEGTATTLAAAGAVSGTPAYLAPEQLTASPLDARVDQFAWAVMAWELLAGERPFPVEPAARLAGIRAGVTRPRRLDPRLGDALVRALAIAPRDRFDSMDELVAALRRPVRSRPRRRMAIAIAAVVAAGGAIAILSVRSDDRGVGGPAGSDAGAAVVIATAAAIDATPAVAPVADGPAPAPATVTVTPSPAPGPAASRAAPRGPAAGARKPVTPAAAAPAAASLAATTAVPGAPEAAAVPDAGAPPPPASAADGRRRFDRDRAERVLADCRFPVNPRFPDELLTGSAVVDWGVVTRREVIRGPTGWRAMMMYEIDGAREVYRVDGASIPHLGVLEAEVGDLVVVCPYRLLHGADVNGRPMPPHWSTPSRPIYAFAPASVTPRIATDLRPMRPVNVAESVLRQFVSDIPSKLANRTLLVWARPVVATGTRWDMGGWTLETADMQDRDLITAGKPLWLVVDRPRVEGSPATRRPVLHGLRALRSLLR